MAGFEYVCCPRQYSNYVVYKRMPMGTIVLIYIQYYAKSINERLWGKKDAKYLNVKVLGAKESLF